MSTQKFTNIFGDTEVAGYSPDADRDYYKVTDAQTDHNYYQDKVCEAIRFLSNNPTTTAWILYGGSVTGDGAGAININAGAALSVNTAGASRIVSWDTQSSVTLPAGWNDNRQIWAVAMYMQTLTSDSRTHKTAAVSYHYTAKDMYLSGDDFFLDSSPSSTKAILGSFKMNGALYADQSVTSSRFTLGIVDTNVALGTSDIKVPSQKAVKTYVDTAVVGSVSAQAHIQKRHTVISGTVDSEGKAAFLVATGTSISIVATATCIMTIANGYNSTGSLDYVYAITTNTTPASWDFSGIGSATTKYLFVAYDGSTTTWGQTQSSVMPTCVYVLPAASAGALGHYAFVIPEMVGYWCTGTAYTASMLLPIGEASITAVPAISAIKTYAINGLYMMSQSTLQAAGTRLSVSHNIGTDKITAEKWYICIDTDVGYDVGEKSHPAEYYGGGVSGLGLGYTRTEIFSVKGAGGTYMGYGTGTGSHALITDNKWNVIMQAERFF